MFFATYNKFLKFLGYKRHKRIKTRFSRDAYLTAIPFLTDDIHVAIERQWSKHLVIALCLSTSKLVICDFTSKDNQKIIAHFQDVMWYRTFFVVSKLNFISLPKTKETLLQTSNCIIRCLQKRFFLFNIVMPVMAILFFFFALFKITLFYFLFSSQKLNISSLSPTKSQIFWWMLPEGLTNKPQNNLVKQLMLHQVIIFFSSSACLTFNLFEIHHPNQR